MDSIEPRSVALLSIRPEFVERILCGEKTVEFRRSTFPDSLSNVVVYCTAPVQRVVAFFSVGETVTDTPSRLLQRFHQVSGIERRAFFGYYEGCDRGRAIRIDDVVQLRKPVVLNRIGSRIVPPQSLRYLDEGLFDRVRRHAA